MHDGGTMISTFEEFADGRYEARMYYAQAGGGWKPPLPSDLQPPGGLGRSRSAGSISRSSTPSTLPDWLLGEIEDWRL